MRLWDGLVGSVRYIVEFFSLKHHLWSERIEAPPWCFIWRKIK